MKYRKLGRTGFEISEIGYGAWGIGGTQWLGGTDDESLAALRRAIELGVNFIDTALAYGDGHSEQLVGQVVRDAGHKIYVATKVPPKNRIWPARAASASRRSFPTTTSCARAEESLRNLGLETIDLLQLHVWNPEWLDRDEWRRAFEDLKRSGKVRAVGISINDHDPGFRARCHPHRAHRHRAGDLQHLRPDARSRTCFRWPAGEHRRAGARAAR